jgi:hypothetical protein
VLTGSVRSRGADTHYDFEYGTTTAYGASTGSADNGSDDNVQAVNATLGGLVPSTTYHYRLVASNASGISYGSDQTFTTGPTPPLPPRVAVGPFKMYFSGYRSGRRHLHLTRVVILGAAVGDRVSYACIECHGSSTRATQIAHASKVTFRIRSLVVSGRSLLRMVLKAPDGSRRVRAYGFLVKHAELKLKSQRCFLPNDHAAVTCPGSSPVKSKPKPRHERKRGKSGVRRRHKRSAKHHGARSGAVRPQGRYR